jgi:hypothetical protein
MALIKCKECSAKIAETAQTCPACGFAYERSKAKNWFQAFSTLSGPLIVSAVSASTAILGVMAFVHNTETEDTVKLQKMIESAVSQNAVQERAAVRTVSYLAKLNKLPPSFAVSILGTVARNGEDEKLRSEAYDAIENLTDERFSLAKFDKYDKLELFCLRAALTPAQHLRQANLRQIEEYFEQHPTDEVLKYQAAAKLLSLSRDVSDPQTIIDMLMSVLACYDDPDMIQKAIPILCSAVKGRDHSGKESNEDVAGFLASAAKTSESAAERNEAVAKAREHVSDAKEAGAKAREAYRSQIRLYLARALVAKDQNLRDDSLAKFAQITIVKGLKEDAQVLLDGISGTVEDPSLQGIADTISSYLATAQEKYASRP